jgi:hypothetical protein
MCGVACVLLIMLWVRSYWWADYYNIRVNLFDATKHANIKGGYVCRTAPRTRLDDGVSKHFYGFIAKHVDHGAAIVLPSWLLIAASVGCAVAPWFSWRQFSVRTLLIATTLVAMVLGLSVWLSR